MLTFPLVAHEHALKTCRIMHRDVSAGNILIIFSIIPPSSEEELYTIVMKGLLSDWELAKVIPETNSAVIASQHERMVSACGCNTFNED